MTLRMNKIINYVYKSGHSLDTIWTLSRFGSKTLNGSVFFNLDTTIGGRGYPHKRLINKRRGIT